MAVSDINFEAEALITDKGVGGINNSSIFGSIRRSAKLIYDGFLDWGLM